MDATSGLVYNWNRWYSPEIGRYVEVDPLTQGMATHLRNQIRSSMSTSDDRPLAQRMQGGLFPNAEIVKAGLRMNAYAPWEPYGYALENPLLRVDPFGLMSDCQKRGICFNIEFGICKALVSEIPFYGLGAAAFCEPIARDDCNKRFPNCCADSNKCT